MKKFNLKKALDGAKLVYRNGEEVKGEFNESIHPTDVYPYDCGGNEYTKNGEYWDDDREHIKDLFMKGKQTTTDKIEYAFKKKNSREQFKDEVLAILAKRKALKDRKKAEKETIFNALFPVEVVEFRTKAARLNPTILLDWRKELSKELSKEQLREILFNWLDEKGHLKHFLINVAKADKKVWNYEKYLEVGEMPGCLSHSFNWDNCSVLSANGWRNIDAAWEKFCKEQGI